MQTSVTRILDIDVSEFTNDMLKKLSECRAYDDNQAEQHIYNSWDLVHDGSFEDIFDEKEFALLEEIEALSVKFECDYFRITH